MEKGWDKTVPFKSPSPLSITAVNALSALLVSIGDILTSLAINLLFHGFLRSKEVCSLRANDICFANNARLSDFLANRAVYVVTDAKTGKIQFVPLSKQTLLRCLKRFICTIATSSGLLFHLPYTNVTASFHAALQHFHLTKQDYRLHSLRHCGATFEWLNNLRMENVMLKGTWEAENTCKRYLNAGKALLVCTTLSSRSTTHIERYASSWCATAERVRVKWPRAPSANLPLGRPVGAKFWSSFRWQWIQLVKLTIPRPGLAMLS